MALAWMLPFALARWTLRGRRGRKKKNGRPTFVQRLAELGSTTLVIALFRNVLFFLVPLWFGSATITSVNIAFPLLLGAMALYSCFDRSYRAQVLERPAMRTAWGFLILFAALVPAVAVVASLPPRPAVVISAAIAFLMTGAALLPRERWFRRRSQGHIVVATLAGAFLLTWVAPALPPVPIVCNGSEFGTGVRDGRSTAPRSGSTRRRPTSTPGSRSRCPRSTGRASTSSGTSTGAPRGARCRPASSAGARRATAPGRI